jgi:hypothetical protein
MALIEVPSIPGIDPKSVRSLLRLCVGHDGASPYARCPHIFYIGDDPYLCITDGSVLVLLLLENGLPDPEEIDWQEDVQTGVGRIVELFGTDYIEFKEDVSIDHIEQWCRVDTADCPLCKGHKLCMFPRYTSQGDNDPKAIGAHTGRISGVRVDRRRIHIVLKMLGVSSGTCDVFIYRGPHVSGDGDAEVVQFVGDNWKVIVAPVDIEDDPERPFPELF